MSSFGSLTRRDNMEDLIEMSRKERTRLEIILRVNDGSMKRSDASTELNVSSRHLRRLLHNYYAGGVNGLISRRRGQPSNNMLPKVLKEQIVSRIKENYPDFGPTLAHEKLTSVDGFKVSLGSVRNIMISSDIWSPRRKKKLKIHQLRKRKKRFGELVQIDGSPHDWFEGRGPICCLLVFVDDATSKLVQLKFVSVESTNGYFEAMNEYLKTYGRPLALYSDKHSIFRVNIKTAYKSDGKTQFSRALEELGIRLICAHSPQAKGRVERANKVLQDRLVKEMRLKGISSIKDANKWLPSFQKEYNDRFSIEPLEREDAHRPLLQECDLDNILCKKEIRTLSTNLEFQYNNKIYQIKTKRPAYAMRKQKVEITERNSGKIEVRYKGVNLNYKIFEERTKQGLILNAKEIRNVETSTLQPEFKGGNARATQSLPLVGEIGSLHQRIANKTELKKCS